MKQKKNEPQKETKPHNPKQNIKRKQTQETHNSAMCAGLIAEERNKTTNGLSFLGRFSRNRDKSAVAEVQTLGGLVVLMWPETWPCTLLTH